MAIQLSGLASGMDTQAIIRDLMQAQNAKVDQQRKAKTKLEWRKDAWDDMNTKIYSFYKKELFNFKMQGTYNNKATSLSREGIIKMDKTQTAVNGSHSIEILQMAKQSNLTSNKIDVKNGTKMSELLDMEEGTTKTIKISISNNPEQDVEVTVAADDSISSLLSKIKKAQPDIQVNFDKNYGRIFMNSAKTGSEAKISLSGDEDLLNALGFTQDNRIGSDGADAKFIYNGVELTSETNDINVNGLSFKIVADTGKVSVAVEQQVDDLYEKVKEFINSYNKLLLEINEKLDAKSSKGYEPLTAEEKKNMTEDDIKLWEERVKGALLRRDNRLADLSYKMRNALAKQVENADGAKYKTLSDLGIVTGRWREKGALHIEGDEEDTDYMGKENKLMKALEEDPEAVVKTLTEIGSILYDTLTEEMKATKNSSALTLYNNKVLDKEIKAYDDKIMALEARLAAIEQRYYRQFTAMEKAMSMAQSQGAWLTQQLGGIQ